MSAILVINSGSSSLKYSLLDIEREHELAAGLIERIGQDASVATHTVRPDAGADAVPTMLDATYTEERSIPDHHAAFAVMLEQFAEHGPSLAEHPPVAVGHRVVHGGARFFAPTLIDADVDKVRAATALVRERAPELLVEGPIQYDAAADAAVAKAKLPDSAVAGRATVFVFPDLNTGNNTYKAVQRSANAVAVGPVMQGLRQPVNDLSRGATVKDIVNTVAITAIQAAVR